MNRLTALQSTSNPTTTFSYAYGKTGNRLSASDRNGSSNYTYDSIYRMTEEAISRSEAKGTLTYGLDPVGNRQSLASTVTGINQQSASYNVNDQVTANSYDANGNTLGANGKSYAYDSFDRMTSFNGGAVTMVYDGDGNRVAKISGGVTTQYLVDDLNPTGLPQVMDEVVGGVVQRTYTYGLQRISQTQVASATTSYYGYDAHGDVRFLTASTGAVTDTYDYDAFGNIVGSTGTTPNVYRYQGEALDSETGLYYMRARYYDPTVGRFLNVDPMTGQGEHPYTYAGADPVNGHDPTGTQDVIETSLLMWLYTAHVPPPQGYMSCEGGILFSGVGSGSGSGGNSGMQADASAGKTMARVEACKGNSKPRSGPTAGSGPKKKRRPMYLWTAGDSVLPGHPVERDRDYDLRDADGHNWGANDVVIYETLGGNLQAKPGTTADKPQNRWIYNDGISAQFNTKQTGPQLFTAVYQGESYPLFVRDAFVCGPHADGVFGTPANPMGFSDFRVLGLSLAYWGVTINGTTSGRLCPGHYGPDFDEPSIR